MGTKNQSMAAKRQKRKTAKRKAVPPERQHRRFVDLMRPVGGVPSQEELMKELATKGIMGVADKYRKLISDPDRGSKGPTNIEVTQSILKIVEMLAPIHSAIEIADILKKDGVILLSEDDVKVINTFDEYTVKLAEDITAIRILMEEDQTFEDFAEIYVHSFDSFTEVMQFHAPAVFSTILKPNQEALEEYAAEHKEPSETDMEFAFRMHDQRMERVQSIYRTVEIPVIPETNADGIPQEFIPADEVCDAELDAEEDPKPIN